MAKQDFSIVDTGSTVVTSGTVALQDPDTGVTADVQFPNSSVGTASHVVLVQGLDASGNVIDYSNRFGGGKSAAVAQVNASGDTTILTPASGKKLRVFWVTAINDPDQTVSPRIRIKFNGGSTIYSAYAIAHWEPFDGPVDGALVVNLDSSGDVAVTVHFIEV